ncbi:hypothetical protein R3P38DRAFT_3396123 [Favolaschia claudopus]|uniref:Uncharacterized protein n=1 Tax=Favolaschia claudopus TaxID=2862362 RepID=A0AAW0BGW4_9AGAR
MGRALFSETYGVKALAIRVQSDNIKELDQSLPVYPDPARWSLSHCFDPDSDEFFQGAEYEAFMDIGEVDRLEHPVIISDSSSDSSDSGRDSPLGEPAPGPVPALPARRTTMIWDRLVDDSAQTLLHDAATSDVSYARVLPLPGADTAITTPTARAPSSSLTAPSCTPPVRRNSTTASDLERSAAAATVSPRRVSVPPISIPAEPSTPSTDSDSLSYSPTTPPAVYTTHVQLMTPSPPPTVTPRIYVWGGARTVNASPASPSVRTAGPLTNPSARQSLVRITPRRRAQNV